MGVTGLWRLLEPVGKPVPLETLENKVLAIDISIWLHQMVKGYKDARGAPLPNAHLMGLFQRLCKLLYYRIKPVFVFDGGFPELKRETIARRQSNKAKLQSKSEKLKKDIMLLIGKKVAIGSILDTNDIKDTISPKKASKSESNSLNSSMDDMFKLPAMPQVDDPASGKSSESSSSDTDDAEVMDLHTLDVQSEAFRALPLREKHDILTEAKETRKQNSWGRLHQLPKESDHFSTYQMDRLLKRRKVQECLEETEKEMSGHFMSLNDLETLLNAEGIDTSIGNNVCKRIASNEHTRYLFIKSVKEAKERAKTNDLQKMAGASTMEPLADLKPSEENLSDEDDELQQAIKMSLDCISEDEKRTGTSKKNPRNSNSFSLAHTVSTSQSADGKITTENVIGENPDEELQEAIQMSLTCDSEGEPSTSNVLADFDFSDCKFPAQELSDESNSSDHSCISSDMNDYYPDFDFVRDTLTRDNKKNVEIECLSKSHRTSESQIMKEVSTSSDDVTDTLPIASCERELAHSIQEQPSPKSVDKESSAVISLETESDSSDEAFEEVLDEEVLEDEKQSIKLVLNIDDIGKQEIEDDIFSDVFKTPNLSMKDSNISETNMNDDLEISSTSKESFKVPMIKVEELPSDKFSVDTKTESTSNQPEEEDELYPNIRNTDSSNNRLNSIESSQTSGEQKERDVITEKERENLEAMSKELDIEHEELLQEQYKMDRMGRNISEQMTKDAKELLQLFGIPYVEAPMEAEAQCAYLESANMTDGTITDDSDIWLFGGRTVYKNFFNQQKHVLQYIAERIEKSFNLAREQMILLALLVGSDYTLGVSGVGPVTAMEILANFPHKKASSAISHSCPKEYGSLTEGLLDFKKWVKAGKRTSVSSLKNKLKNVEVTEDFPSIRVVQAYFEPEVEKSKEAFTWGVPEVTVLREFTRTKFGWSQSKLDEILKPVLKRMNEKKHQHTIHSFFKRNVEFHTLEDKMSKRVKQAVEQMAPGGGAPQGEGKGGTEVQTKVVRKRVKKIIKEDDVTEEINKEIEEKKRKVSGGKEREPRTQEELKVDKIVRIDGVTTSSNVQSDLATVTPLLQRYQEIIPQREKDKQNLLNNKLRAIELFRKTKLDRKKTKSRRTARAPKHSAQLSESSDSN